MLIVTSKGSLRQYSEQPMAHSVSKVTITKMSAHAARLLNNREIKCKVIHK